MSYLHKRGKYYICHYRELFKLDGYEREVTNDDIKRRNGIAKLLQWNLCKIVERIFGPHYYLELKCRKKKSMDSNKIIQLVKIRIININIIYIDIIPMLIDGVISFCRGFEDGKEFRINSNTVLHHIQSNKNIIFSVYGG